MTSTIQPTVGASTTELLALIDRAGRLVAAARRTDLRGRLTRVRERITDRTVCVELYAGGPGQGVTSLVTSLEDTPADRLPDVRFVETPEPDSSAPVLFVSDAGHPYGPEQLAVLARLRGRTVIGVLTKIDEHEGWAETQRANRRQLQDAGLDEPPIPLLPVSARRYQDGRDRGDEALVVVSGVPQLVDFLRDRVFATLDPELSAEVRDELRLIVEALSTSWNGELDAVHRPGAEQELITRQRHAVAELERRRQLAVTWQLALGDGATDLMAQLDHDLRGRLRGVMRAAEQDIQRADPAPRWTRFGGWLRGEVEREVQDNFRAARERSRMLADQVAGQLTGGPSNGMPLPVVRMDSPDELLRGMRPLEPLDSGKVGVLQRVLNSVRGSYGGVLMVGVLTSLAGMPMVNRWSVAAGLLLGVNTYWEDRRTRIERRRSEAKAAVSKLMDEVIFQVGEQSRAGLRQAHRTLRDHFTPRSDERLRAAEDAVRAATDAVQNRGARSAELQANLAQLRQLKLGLSSSTVAG